jgi:hypothetical protein
MITKKTVTYQLFLDNFHPADLESAAWGVAPSTRRDGSGAADHGTVRAEQIKKE